MGNSLVSFGSKTLAGAVNVTVNVIVVRVLLVRIQPIPIQAHLKDARVHHFEHRFLRHLRGQVPAHGAHFGRSGI